MCRCALFSSSLWHAGKEEERMFLLSYFCVDVRGWEEMFRPVLTWRQRAFLFLNWFHRFVCASLIGFVSLERHPRMIVVFTTRKVLVYYWRNEYLSVFEVWLLLFPTSRSLRMAFWPCPWTLNSAWFFFFPSQLQQQFWRAWQQQQQR